MFWCLFFDVIVMVALPWMFYYGCFNLDVARF